MSTLYGATDDFFKIQHILLNIDSNGTLWSVSPRASAGTLVYA